MNVRSETGAPRWMLGDATPEGQAARLPNSHTSVGIASNCVIVNLDDAIASILARRGDNPRFIHGSFGQISTDVRTFGDAGIEHVVVLIHFDSMTENLAWTEAARNFGNLQEIIDFRLSDLAEVVALLPSATTLHVSSFFGGTTARDPWAAVRRRAHAYLDGKLESLAQMFSNVRVLDVQSVLETVGLETATDVDRFTRYSMPLTTEGIRAVASVVAQSIERKGLLPKKVLVLDGDNTLWGSVLGEVGVQGVQLHPTVFPGSVYYRAQLAYREMKRDGALLALVTKNELQDIELMLSSNPNCALSVDDFVAVRASWEPKAQVIERLADELGLGLESFVFVDDSLVETTSVAEQLPVVETFRVPPEPAEYFRLLSELWHLFGAAYGRGLKDRTDLYRVRASARELELRSKTREEYLRDLRTVVTVEENREDHFDRVSELSQRTNQFNLGLTRLSRSEVDELYSSPDCTILTYTVTDRFGPSGVSAAAIVQTKVAFVVTELWISCRVLGRGVESAVLSGLGALASQRGYANVLLRFRPGPRNQQVSDLVRPLAITVRKFEEYEEFELPASLEAGEGRWVEMRKQ